jgi:hypothetical protein
MADIPEVKILDADLIKVMADRKLTGPEAKKIISDIKKVLIEGVEAKEKSRSSTSISVEAPSNLSEKSKSWGVILLSRDAEEEDQIIAILDYDPVTKKFPAPDDEEDDDEEGP